MKLHLTLAASAILLAGLPISTQAAPVTIGKSPASSCAQLADRQSRAAILDADRHAGLDLCDQALSRPLSNSDRVATLINRGILETAANRTADALADFDAALTLDPARDAAYLNRGSALLNASRYSEAIADFNHVIAKNNESAVVAYFNRGVAYEKMGDVQSAYRDYAQASKLNPNYEAANIELARFHLADKRYADNR